MPLIAVPNINNLVRFQNLLSSGKRVSRRDQIKPVTFRLQNEMRKFFHVRGLVPNVTAFTLKSRVSRSFNSVKESDRETEGEENTENLRHVTNFTQFIFKI